MWLFIAIAVIFLLLLITCGLVTYARWNFGKLEKQGIPVVRQHHFLLGGAMLSFQKNPGLLEIEHMKKYGDVFGLYEGREPQIFICDAELIRLITTKDAAHFDGKRPVEFGNDPLLNEFPALQPFKKWKTVRGMISPVLNSLAGIKNSGGAMQEATKDFLNSLKEEIKKNGGKLEKYNLESALFVMLTDLIARSQLGIYIGKSENCKRFGKCVHLLTHPPPGKITWITAQAFKYAYAFPFLKRFITNPQYTDYTRKFVHLFKQMLDVRRQQNTDSGSKVQGRERDFLDFLLEWHDNLETDAELKNCGISEYTIYNLALTMFIAGQGQISFILSALMVCVAENPEIEKKLCEEVDKAWEQSNGVFDHETVSEMNYLNACILEATRLYTFFVRGDRICTKDWENEERNIQIKKGDVVILAIWAANRNPKYFDEPDKFKPERFMPGNKEKIHPYAFTSFGFGPRNCVGKRLALEIMRILAAYLVKHLKFVKRSDTELKFLPGGPLLATHAPIVLDVQRR